MSKKMLINATHPEENRVAIVDDGILTELDIEIAGKEQTKGNIYKAVVVRVEPGLQAAFIDYGGERFGFLQMGEIHPSYFRSTEGNGEKPKHPRINDVLRRGQELLVQIVKEERGTKGAALTTYLSLPGRFMVLMPDSDTKGVSRKIEDESQRKKLKEAMASLDLPEGMGYIVRTAGIGQSKEELRRDFDYLVRVFEKIQEHSRQAKAPALVYKESNLVIRSLRDYFSADMDEVLVDDPRVCDEAKEFFQEVMPEFARLVKLHQEKRPIFARYQIEEQIETITKNKVPLPSGGSIVIDATEALVAIDVNSGKMAGEQGVEATAYKTNLEAAAEAARQLRLRDLGGLIVIDFIDMRERKHIREIEKRLKDALKYDKARVTVGRISQFGLLEMSRQRIKATLAEGSYLPCPHCHGSGRIKSAEAQAIAFLRKIHAAVAKGQVGRIDGEIPLEVATYLLNMKREELVDMERRHQVTITIKGRPDFIAGQSELTTHRREKDELAVYEFLPAIAPPPPLSPQEPIQTEAPIPEAADEEEKLANAGEDAGRKKRKRKKRKKRAEEVPVGAETPAAIGEEVARFAPEETEAVDVEAAEVAAEDESVPPAEMAEAGTEEGARKKRKRKRRKKKPEIASAGDIVEPKTEGVTAEPTEDVAVGEAHLGESAIASAEEEVSSELQEERKRKRRRRKKKPTAATPEHVEGEVAEGVQPETVETVQPEPIEAVQPEPVEAVESEPIEAGRPEPIETVQPEPVEAVESEPIETGREMPSSAVEIPMKSATPAGDEGAPPEAKPKRRPSRPRRKTAAAPAEEETAAAAPTETPLSATGEDTEKKATKRPRPSRRKRPEGEPVPPVEASEQEATSAPPADETEEKTKKRATRKKAAAKEKTGVTTPE